MKSLCTFLSAILFCWMVPPSAHAGIVVEQPVGTGLTSGTSVTDFGSVIIGATGGTTTFTVRNTGPGVLSGLAVSVDGTARLDYTVNSFGLPATLAAGASATFTVAFRPWQDGPRAAVLHIASDDSVLNSFEIALTGIGLTQPGPGQTIATTAVPAWVKTTAAPFTLMAGATSGLPVSYAVLAGPANVSNEGLVAVTGTAGVVTIRISQAGGSGYGPTDSFVTFIVAVAGQEIVKLGGGPIASHCVAIRANGTLWTWGSNEDGKLGYATNELFSPWSRVPGQVGTGTNWASAACGSRHTVAVKTNGTLWAWGRNSAGQLGDGTIFPHSSPVQIGSASNWVRVACGDAHTAALKSDGTLWIWGYNANGELGDGTQTNRSSPLQVGTSAIWTEVACGGSHTVALKSDGTLWAWGANHFGCLGDGTMTIRTSPVRIGTAVNWAKVACGSSHTVAVQSDGTCWAWGSNGYGQLATNDSYHFSPLRIGNDSNWIEVACGANHTMAVKSDRTLWGFGQNSYGQLGDGEGAASRASPVRIGTATYWTAVTCGGTRTVAVRDDASLWSWGYDEFDNPNLNPIQSGLGNNWDSVSSGASHTVAVRSDGTLWSWGYNGYGQLGLGNKVNVNRPIQIGTASNWNKVACGDRHTLAVKGDGTLWAWGENVSGQLGDGTNTSRMSPVRVGLANNWSTVACGNRHTIAVRSDGTLWAWGDNGFGQLGDGTTTSQLSPVRIGLASNWAVVACGQANTLARKSDGTLWVSGTADGSSTLTQIGTESTWTEVACSNIGSLKVAMKSDGTLWGWGDNASGQQGRGNATRYTSPVRIGTASDWSKVSFSYEHGMGVKTDGSLWAWSTNAYGQLGDGTKTKRSTPVRIGTSNAWLNLPANLGSEFSMVLTSDGKLWSCGRNQWGQLGSVDTSVPNRVWPARAAQTLNLPALPALVVGDPVVLAAVSGSKLPVTYGFTGPATLNGNVLTPTAPGLIHLIAWQPGDLTWDTTEPLRQSQTAIVSSNANLAGLSLSVGTLTTAFASGTTDYTAVVTNATAGLTLSPTLANVAASVTVEDVPVASGNSSGILALTIGHNVVTTRVTAQDGTAMKTYTITVTRQSALQSWQQTHFGAAVTDTAANEDFNHNGIDNLLEFAFGTNPVTSISAPLQYNGTFAGGGGVNATGQPIRSFESTATGIDFRVLFVRRKDFEAAGLTYVPQFGAEMQNWTSSAAVPTILADDGTYQIVSVPYPPFVGGGNKARFFRVQVTLVP